MRTWHKVEEVPISLEDLQGLPRGVRQELDLFCYHTKKVMHIPIVGMNTMNMAVYLNHSKKPSVAYQKNGQLKTLRAIRTGETPAVTGEDGLRNLEVALRCLGEG
jgi:hypothetical protein